MFIDNNQDQLLAFARLHDWGQTAVANDDGSVSCTCEVNLADGTWTTETARFTRMSDLRDWAGY
jgi:hypothetical protein